MSTVRAVGWGLVAAVMVALAIPWFLWGASAVIAGLPIWIWWHIGWLALLSAVFYVFTRTDWGIGVETSGGEIDG